MVIKTFIHPTAKKTMKMAIMEIKKTFTINFQIMRKILFTIASCIAGTVIFIACSCEETFETVENYSASQQSHQKQLKTRTCVANNDNIQKRLNEIGEKYNKNIKMIYIRNLSEITEDVFLNIEQNIATRAKGKDPLCEKYQNKSVIKFIDDSCIDNIKVATLSDYIENNYAEPVNNYDCFFQIDYTHPDNYLYHYDYFIEIKCNINETHNTASATFEDWTPYNNSSKCYNFQTSTINSNSNATYFAFSFNFYIPSPANRTIIIDGSYNNGISYMYSTDSRINISY